MDEIEMVIVFLQAQEADYFQNMMSAMGKPFAEAIKISEMVENGLKTGRILSQFSIRATSQAIQGGSGGVAKGKKKEETSMAASGARKHRTPRSLFSERTPQHYYPHQDVRYAPQPYTVMNSQPYVRPQQQANQNQASFSRNQTPYQNHYNPQPPQNNFHPREPPKRPNFTPIIKTYSSLLPNLVQMGPLYPVPQTRQNLASPAYRVGTRCAYHSGAEGHDTDDCWTLKRAMENLIGQKKIVLRDENIPNVTNNPLSAHNNGPVIGIICEDKEFDLALKAIIAITDGVYVMWRPINPPRLSEPMVIGRASQKPMTDPTAVPWNYNKSVVTYKGKEISGEVQENNPAEKYFNSEEVNNATRKRFPSKKPVSAEEAEAFFRKMKMADYEVIDQLREFPAQVSLLSLLMNSTEHKKVLIKTLNEAYVPVETSIEQLERMAKIFFAINQISFSKNDLPPEGAAHNKALSPDSQMRRVLREKSYVGRRLWDDRKNDGWALPQLVPHLYRKFVKPKYNEEMEDKAFTTEEIEEICGTLRKILYEAHMVQLGEGSSTAEVLYMGPNAKLQNWKAMPFPIRRESR
ncbi:uncharacterized protein LOC142165737 [Nicotiana tabacum]|uniref:Uncharacterized protein LOC142165737 n=1 Tax=Nicotiana tabacum TaxID=4097 RepID=A0AC58S5D6_TOBAC